MIYNHEVPLRNIRAYLPLIQRFYEKVEDQMSPMKVMKSLGCCETTLLGSEKDNIPKAYTLAQIDNLDLILHQVYSEDRECTLSLEKYVSKWAYKLGLEHLVIYTKRKPLVLEKKYGFKLVHHKLVKEITNGQFASKEFI